MIITIDMVSGEIIEDSTEKEATTSQDATQRPLNNMIEIPELAQIEITDATPNTPSPVLFDIANTDIEEFIDGMQ